MNHTALIGFHRSQNAKLVDFAGWEMPVLYTGIQEEHVYTRDHCSMFDVSHMGRLDVRGERAEAFLQKVCTRNVGEMKIGQSRYSHLCNEAGGILDDIIVSRFEDHHLIVCNASNTPKVTNWLGRLAPAFEVKIENRTAETAMIAIQGPDTMHILGQLLPFKVDDLKRYHFKAGEIMGAAYAVFRSGYTGEDGVEVIMPASLAVTAVNMLVGKSEEIGWPIKPAGLGARDTLRMEAGMPLYGHELTEQFDSISAGLAWAVDLSKEFIGQAALKRVSEEGPRRKLAGFDLDGRRIARQGAAIFSEGREVGVVTSGTQSPTFDKVIAMGYLDAALCEPGRKVEIDIRGSRATATVVALPFYKRAK